MQRKLLIKVLEIIEKERPSVDTRKIADETGLELNGDELLQIVNYLIDSGKVHPIYKNSLPHYMNGAEKLKMLHEGVDLLTELKSQQQKDNLEVQQVVTNRSIGLATIVLALAAFMGLATTFMFADWHKSFEGLGSWGLALAGLDLFIFAVMLTIIGALIVVSYNMLLSHKKLLQ